MSKKFFSVAGSVCLMTVSYLAHANCSGALAEQIANTTRIVDSLHPEKPGQMRVYAYDGTEYTAGQALWMQGQLRSIQQACAQGAEASAVSSMQGVMKLVRNQRKAHHGAA